MKYRIKYIKRLNCQCWIIEKCVLYRGQYLPERHEMMLLLNPEKVGYPKELFLEDVKIQGGWRRYENAVLL